MPNTVDTRKHCKVGLRACNNLLQPRKTKMYRGGCRRLLHALNPTLQCVLVSTVFGTVSSLHLTSLLMIFNLFQSFFPAIGMPNDTLGRIACACACGTCNGSCDIHIRIYVHARSGGLGSCLVKVPGLFCIQRIMHTRK